MSTSRRSILLGTAATLLAKKVQAFLFAKGGPTSGPITTLTLLNTSGSQQAAGTPTPIFGWVFKDGDIAPGSAPIFTLNGVVQPFSAGLQTYWPSGCLKFAAFMLLPTTATGGNSSQTVMISKGGSWPAASGRTLTEIYNQNIIVNAPLYNSPNNGRGGSTATIKSWLNGDSNQIQVVKWLDGTAGTAWRITTHMAQTKGGTRDGMLMCDHYIIALNNNVGGLGGYRWLGAMRQPFYNQSGQANNSAGTYLFFAAPSTSNPTNGVNWSIQPGGSGPVTTTPLTWLGSDGNNFQNATFSCAGSGTQTCIVTSNGGSDNYYMGGDYNMLPVIFSNIATSQGASQGSNVISGGFGFLYTDDGGNPTTAFELYSNGQYGGANKYTFNGPSFTGTVNPAPCLPPFQRMFFATKDATYNFFQGTGTLTSDSTALLVQINQAYWQGSKVIPPYNLSVNGIAMGGTLNEYVYSQDWYSYSVGQMTVYEPGTGDHSDIGIVPLYASNDFYNQTANTLRHNRIIGLSCAFTVTDFLDATSNSRVNFGNPSGAYGLAALSNSNLFLDVSHYANGSNFAVPGTTALGYGLSLGEHEPAWPIWAYLRTGEFQYLDLIVDQLQMSEVYSGSLRTLNSGSAGISSTQYGVVYFGAGGGEIRFLAWGIRNAQWAAHLYPRDPSGNNNNPVFTDGTNLAQYLTDVADANASWPLLQFQTPAPTIPWTTWTQTNGHWYPWYAYPVAVFGGVNSPAFGINGASWEYADMAQVMCLAVARGNANAKTFLQNCIAVQWAHDLQVLGGWLFISDSNRAGFLITDGTGNYTQTLITNDSQYGMAPFSLFANIVNSHNYITWAPNSSSPAFFMNTAFNSLNYGWTPANGDAYITEPYAFGNPNDLWPSELTEYSTYYAINTTASGSNWEFDLATTPNGSKIAISDTSGAGVSLGFRLQPVNKPPIHSCYTEVYECNFWFACCWAVALGVSGFGSVTNTSTMIGDVQHRMVNSGINPAGGVSVSPQGIYSNGPGTVDTRYCMQPSFS